MNRIGRTAAGLLAAAVGLGAGRAEPEGAPLEGWNLLFVLMDTLRSDHLSTYGYEHATSPFLDRLADEAVVFETSYSSSSFTRESVAALFTGLMPSTSGAGAGWNARPAEAVKSLGEMYRDAGYRTGFFSSTVMLTDERYLAGFEEIDQLARRPKETRPGRRAMTRSVTERALEFVGEHAEERFLAYVHYLDPHAPYTPPRALRRQQPAPVAEERLSLYGDVRPSLRLLLADGFGPGEERFEDLVARYDAEIHLVDRALEQMVARLRELEIADRTLVILTSDHGEEFLEHGFVEHGWTIYEETTRVPLVFWAPGKLAAARVDTPVSGVDVVPTLEHLFGLSNATDASAELSERAGPPLAGGAGRFTDGVSLFDDELRPLAARGPVVTETAVPHRCVARAIVADGWKLIVYRKTLTPGVRSTVSANETMHQKNLNSTFDAYGPVVREELFHLAEDPSERTDLLESHPDRAAELRALLAAFESRARRVATDAPAEEEDLDPDLLDDIEALGY